MIAFDTNILVYAQLEEDAAGRHDAARRLVQQFGLARAITPVQVLAEFLNVCKRKLGMAPLDATAQVADYRAVFECPVTSIEDVTNAAWIAERYRLAYFDALIIAVAIAAGATILLSEDMQDGLQVDGLTIINPFAPDNAAQIAEALAAAQ